MPRSADVNTRRITTTRATEAGCSVVMLIMIIIIRRVRDEAELGDQMLGRSAPPKLRQQRPPNTASNSRGRPAHSSNRKQ
jgi:hypothetical protein